MHRPRRILVKQCHRTLPRNQRIRFKLLTIEATAVDEYRDFTVVEYPCAQAVSRAHRAAPQP